MNINKNIAISETGFIFNPSTGDSFSTNLIGKEIIQLIQMGQTIDEVVDSVQQKFTVDKSTLEKDIADFMYMLKSYNILKDDDQA